MKSDVELAIEFVEFIPEELESQTLYISLKYKTAVHRCCCGCGTEVVTPISPTGWCLDFDGRTVSLHPSIGNWSMPCRSHYFIENNKVIWATALSEERIAAGRARVAMEIEGYYGKDHKVGKKQVGGAVAAKDEDKKPSIWKRVVEFFWSVLGREP